MTHYIPITDADRQAMLKAIGVERIEDLFVDVPASHRFPPLDLPPPLSEPELMAELNRLSELNAHARRYSIFLGAGAYNHFVPAAVDQICAAASFTLRTPRTNRKSAKALCRPFSSIKA